MRLNWSSLRDGGSAEAAQSTRREASTISPVGELEGCFRRALLLGPLFLQRMRLFTCMCIKYRNRCVPAPPRVFWFVASDQVRWQHSDDATRCGGVPSWAQLARRSIYYCTAPPGVFLPVPFANRVANWSKRRMT